jgi:CheY-like chemotaxis protein
MGLVLGREDHWQPVTVPDGASAIQTWSAGNVDVILMDVKLPDMDGIEVTRRIRAAEKSSQRRHTPVIAFSAMTSKECRQQCLDAGVDDFLAKPTDMKTLIETIHKHLPTFPG